MKRVFSYRVELCMVFLILTFPLFLLASMTVQEGLFFGGFVLVGAYLLMLRLGMLIKYAYKYHEAGLCSICGLSLFLSAPVFMMFITGVLSYSVGRLVSWIQVYFSFCLTLILSLPLLMMMRTEFLLIAVLVFSQVLVAGILLAQYLDKRLEGPALYPFIPLITTILTLKVIRRFLSSIIDPCLVIR